MAASRGEDNGLCMDYEDAEEEEEEENDYETFEDDGAGAGNIVRLSTLHEEDEEDAVAAAASASCSRNNASGHPPNGGSTNSPHRSNNTNSQQHPPVSFSSSFSSSCSASFSTHQGGGGDDQQQQRGGPRSGGGSARWRELTRSARDRLPDSLRAVRSSAASATILRRRKRQGSGSAAGATGDKRRLYPAALAVAVLLLLSLQIATLAKISSLGGPWTEPEACVANFEDGEEETRHEVLLLRQDLVSPGGDNASRVFRPDQFLDLNSDDPTAPLFSRMKDLQKYRRRKDGLFHFLLCYPTSSSIRRNRRPCYEFVQGSDPTEVTEAAQEVEGFRALEWLAGEEDSFRGLRSDSRPMALLDGSKGSLWYWAVGAASTYLGNQSVPGPEGATTGRVELYAVLGGNV